MTNDRGTIVTIAEGPTIDTDIETDVEVHHRTCPLCEATCGLEITTRGEQVVRIRGDRENPFSRGFICPKGSSLKQLHEDPDRLRAPLIRRGDDPATATWEEVSWEAAFAEVERGLTAEGRPGEFGLPTFPSRRFVQAGGLTVVHEGLLEYELVDVDDRPDGTGPAAGTLALTLLRATGMLSRLGMSLRPLPAGPMNALDGPQMLGPVDVTYALAVSGVDPFDLADDILVPLQVTSSFGGGDRADRGSELTVDGARVSSVRRNAGALEVRVFNPADDEATVSMPGRSGWLVDLRGRPLSPFEGSFPLRPHGIATVRLDAG